MSEFEGDESVVTTPHLDDETFTEMTLGAAPDGKAQMHLASCEACRAELNRFEDAVGGFSVASLAWSEEKSAELAALRPAALTGAGRRILRITGLGWAVAALLALGLAVPVTMHESLLHREAAARAAAEDDPTGLNSPEQIAKDNQLMADVNYELVHSQELEQQLGLQRNGLRQAGATKGVGERRNP